MKSTAVSNKKIPQCIISLLFAIASTVFYTLFVSYKLETPFFNSDQIILREILSGSYSGTPDTHLVYILYPLSATLVFLTRLFPAVRWFDLLMLATYPIGCFLICFSLTNFAQKVFSKFVTCVVATSVFLVCTPFFVVQNEYTVNSSIYAIAGILFLIQNIRNKDSHNIIYNITSVFCFLMSLWIRTNVFLMALPLILCTSVVIILATKKYKQTLITNISLLILIIITLIVDKSTYKNPEWQDYLAYNDCVTVLYDFSGVPDYSEHKEVYDSLGFTYSEYLGLVNEYDLVKTNTTEKFTVLADLSGKNKATSPSFHTLLATLKSECIASIKQPAGLFIILITLSLVLIAIYCLVKNKNKKWLLYMLLSIAGIMYYLAFATLFIYNGRFIDRVSVPLCYIILTYVTAVAIAIMYEVRSLNANGLNITSISYALAGTIFITGIVLLPNKILNANNNIHSKESHLTITKAVSELCIANPDGVYFVNDVIAASTAVTSDSRLTYNLPNNYIPLCFWISGSPIDKKRLARLGIENTVDRLMTGDNVYFVCPANSSIEWLVDLCSDYGSTVEFEPEEIINAGSLEFTLYRITAVN